jgi:hypothetical protein
MDDDPALLRTCSLFALMDITLNSRDLKAFAQFCADLGTHSDPATFADAASRALARLIDCERVIHVEYPSLWENPRYVNTRPLASDAAHFAYAATHSHEHPLAAVWEAESRPEAVYRLSDHIPLEKWRKTEFYRLGQPTNKFSIMQSYRLGRGGMGTFALERMRRDFTDREMALLALGYSAYRALEERLRLAMVDGEQRAVVEEHLSVVAEASLQVDRYGRVLSATAKARRLLAAQDAADQLPARLAGWWQACITRPGERRPLVHTEPSRGNKWLKPPASGWRPRRRAASSGWSRSRARARRANGWPANSGFPAAKRNASTACSAAARIPSSRGK